MEDDTQKGLLNFDMKPHPKAIVEKEALEVSGKNLQDLASDSHIPFTSAFRQVNEFLDERVDKYDKQDKMFLVGYNNASFDNPFFRAFFKQNNHKYFGSYFYPNPLDVYVLATEKLKEVRHEMENFKLHTVAKELGIEVDESKLHDAEYDLNLTWKIYKKVTR